VYKNKYHNFLIDGNVKLVHGWAKQTDKNHFSLDEFKSKKRFLNPLDWIKFNLQLLLCLMITIPFLSATSFLSYLARYIIFKIDGRKINIKITN